MRRKHINWSNLKCEHGNGTFAVIDGSLLVKTCHGSKSQLLAGHSPEGLARILMQEISNDHAPDPGAI
jgi:hypothetical protein